MLKSAHDHHFASWQIKENYEILLRVSDRQLICKDVLMTYVLWPIKATSTIAPCYANYTFIYTYSDS